MGEGVYFEETAYFMLYTGSHNRNCIYADGHLCSTAVQQYYKAC